MPVLSAFFKIIGHGVVAAHIVRQPFIALEHAFCQNQLGIFQRTLPSEKVCDRQIILAGQLLGKAVKIHGMKHALCKGQTDLERACLTGKAVVFAQLPVDFFRISRTNQALAVKGIDAHRPALRFRQRPDIRLLCSVPCRLHPLIGNQYILIVNDDHRCGIQYQGRILLKPTGSRQVQTTVGIELAEVGANGAVGNVQHQAVVHGRLQLKIDEGHAALTCHAGAFVKGDKAALQTVLKNEGHAVTEEDAQLPVVRQLLC